MMLDAETQRDELLARLLDEALAELRARGRLDFAAWKDRHPEHAADLPALLEILGSLDDALSVCRSPAQDTVNSEADHSWPDSGANGEGDLQPPGQQIGSYLILQPLGAGAMGVVYKAHDPQLRRVVAIKVPRLQGPREGRSPLRQRFLREARAAAAIRHPHVCPIYDVGEQDDVPYVVMAFVEGQSLADWVANRCRFDDCRQAVRLAVQVAEALEAVHAHGIVHRDLKPGNVLLDAAGQAVLTDFGLSRPEHDSGHLTAEGALLGTPAYMAPEQVTPLAGKVGPWTDLYSLGVTLYQMLTGRLPYEGSATR